MDQLVWHVIPNRKLSLEMLEQHCANWQLMNELTLLTTDKAIQNSQLKVVREGANFVENISRHKSVGVDQFLEHALQLRDLLELTKSAFVTPFEFKVYSGLGDPCGLLSLNIFSGGVVMQQTHDLNSCLKSSANNSLSKHNALIERTRCINAPEHKVICFESNPDIRFKENLHGIIALDASQDVIMRVFPGMMPMIGAPC